MSESIRLSLLGPFQAHWKNGAPLQLTGKKIQGLIAYLGVEHDRPHSRSELATLLWSESGQERARHNLRQAVSKIRGLCPDLLEVHDDLLSLAQSCEVDVQEFQHLVDSEDLGEVERAIVLYRHDLLTGLSLQEEAFGDWLWDARARLRDRASGAFERLAEGLSAEGREEDAIEMWRRRLDFDPACEPAHRSLMQALFRLGRRSDALRQYQKCKKTLDRELGVEPSPETEDLLRSIRSPVSSNQMAQPSNETHVASSTAALAQEPIVPNSEQSAEPPSVAVLAFESLSEAQDRYLADGIAEDIITSLSSFGSLLVISRESSFAFRSQNQSITEIGRRLGAQFVVRGSVRLIDQRMRLNVQLIETASGRHLWAQHYDRQLSDLFTVQDEVTETVVSTLAGRVEAARLARARRKQPEHLDAYDCLLRGKELHHRVTAEACERSIELFEQAIERDGDLAMAHAWLGCGFGQAMVFRPEDRESLLDQAEAAALRARELDESEPECHRILFHVAVLRKDLPRARSHIERAVALNPNDDRIVCALGTLCALEGRAEEAEHWVRKSMRLNPFHSESVWFHLGRSLFQLGRNQEALEALSRVTAPRIRELVYRLALYGSARTERIGAGDSRRAASQTARFRPRRLGRWDPLCPVPGPRGTGAVPARGRCQSDLESSIGASRSSPSRTLRLDRRAEKSREPFASRSD